MRKDFKPSRPIKVPLLLIALNGKGSTCQINDTIISCDFIAAISISSPFAQLTTTPAYNPSEKLTLRPS
jgi:hypothetical protein